MTSAVASDRRLLRVVARHPVGSFLAWAFPVSQAIAFQPVLTRERYDVDLPTHPVEVGANRIVQLLHVVEIRSIHLSTPDND